MTDTLKPDLVDTGAVEEKKPAASKAEPRGTATFRIWRGDRERGRLVDYTTRVAPGMVVLDAVHEIQAEQANDLAVRWNCKAGKCGSCSAEVNGMPKLMCMTRLSELPLEKPVTVEPMRSFPPVKDLVTDVSWNFRVKPKIEDRVEDLRRAHGVGYCNITKCCTQVCPEHITITDNAIIPLKERVVDEFYDPLGRLTRLFSRRPEP